MGDSGAEHTPAGPYTRRPMASVLADGSTTEEVRAGVKSPKRASSPPTPHLARASAPEHTGHSRPQSSPHTRTQAPRAFSVAARSPRPPAGHKASASPRARAAVDASLPAYPEATAPTSRAFHASPVDTGAAYSLDTSMVYRISSPKRSPTGELPSPRNHFGFARGAGSGISPAHSPTARPAASGGMKQMDLHQARRRLKTAFAASSQTFVCMLIAKAEVYLYWS